MMMKIQRPHVVIDALQSTNESSPNRDVTVFNQGEFLFGSFQNGREQVLDIRAHDRTSLLAYLDAWKAKQ